MTSLYDTNVPPPNKHGCSRVFGPSSLSPGLHVCRYTHKWNDDFSHVLISAVNDSHVEYYECVPKHQTSNVAVIRCEQVPLDRLVHTFFNLPTFVVHRDEYHSSPKESVERAEKLYNEDKKFQCDGVFSVWNFYSSEVFVYYCKTGVFKTSTFGLKSLVASPLKSLQRSDRYDLERDLGKREDAYDAEMCAAGIAGVVTGVKSYTKEGPGKVVAQQVVARAARTNVLRQVKEHPLSKSVTGKLGRMTAGARSGAKPAAAPPSPASAAAVAALVAVPVTAAETALHVRNRWNNIDSLVEEGVVEEDRRDFYRKKYAAMSVTGNSVSCGCIVGGAAAGALIPVPVAGVVLGAVGGAVVGAVGNFGARRVAGSIADRMDSKARTSAIPVSYCEDSQDIAISLKKQLLLEEPMTQTDLPVSDETDSAREHQTDATEN